jgi:putative phosphoribosyl transferase
MRGRISTCRSSPDRSSYRRTGVTGARILVMEREEPVEPDEREVEIRADDVVLSGALTVPVASTGVVVFAHGTGSSRLSPRNRMVASWLHQAGLATLLFDLLTPEEADHRANVFDIELLAERLARATGWVRAEAGLDAPLGYVGASTGAAAALWAAAERLSHVRAVVSRGGRPDLAGRRLPAVRAPTLLIVGGRDEQVLKLNREAMGLMKAEVELVVVPGATHLFEEPGTLEQAGDRARAWFTRWLRPEAGDVE